MKINNNVSVLIVITPQVYFRKPINNFNNFAEQQSITKINNIVDSRDFQEKVEKLLINELRRNK